MNQTPARSADRALLPKSRLRLSSQVFEAVKGYVADGWTGDFADGHDIAVLKLDRRATNLTLPLLGSGGVPITFGDSMTATGWGKTEAAESVRDIHINDKLIIAEQESCKNTSKTLDNSSWICIKSLREDACEGNGVPAFLLCISSARTRDNVVGDTDGPLLLADAPNRDITAGNPKFDMIVGVASCGSTPAGQCSICEPAVYTSVDHYLDWIREITQRRSKARSSR